ncbi:HlyC/CorC family transporter [Nanchangia anserum]|uniref:HlyC/CorC family transporter n=1 Tax=Nanchangia anserum TaxID=2692125 RepID=A0A8I0G8W6_9ACTO|nr:hemolysin family protein [Nanchangia anserum]MBD3690047.1 HlyC/CorC family transporter [Nanchangia anserum]QOX82157.1 HlyC/CorC family transporter [Nanchangia anserum]
MSSTVSLIVAVVLLAINAFFVAGEFCVTSSRKAQIDPLVDQGRRGAGAAQWALENVSLMLAVTQLGITLASTGLGAVAEPALAHVIEAPLAAIGAPSGAAHAVAFVVALVIVVVCHILFGEMIPKNLTVSAPVPVVLALAPTLVRIARVLRPVVRVLNAFANACVRLSGHTPRDEVSSTFTVEEVQAIVERSAEVGALDDDLGLLSGTLEFSEESVADAMVGLDRLYTLSVGCTPGDVERAVAKTGFSRFPVIDEEGRLIGYLHLKDVLYASVGGERDEPVPSWRIRGLPVARVDDEVEDALALMQKSGVHLAKVLRGDDVVGVIFLEDILEELVGEVRDAMPRT